MRRFATAIIVVALLSVAVSCGGGTLFISATDNGVSFFAVSGTVSIVQLTIVNGSQVTVVTLIGSGTAQTFNFCGNVVSQFPSNAFVNVSYSQNGVCDTVVQVIQ
jgi:hypothetical protein